MRRPRGIEVSNIGKVEDLPLSLVFGGFALNWIALALFCLGRVIAVTSSKSYESDEWTDVTLMWCSLEKSFLVGDGRHTAKAVLQLKKELLPDLPEIIGSRMMHGLAEAAINAGETRLFQ